MIQTKIVFTTSHEAYAFADVCAQLSAQTPFGLMWILVVNTTCVAGFAPEGQVIAWQRAGARCGGLVVNAEGGDT